MGQGMRESSGVGVECGVGSAGVGYPPRVICLTSFTSASAIGFSPTPQKALFININCVISNSN